MVVWVEVSIMSLVEDVWIVIIHELFSYMMSLFIQAPIIDQCQKVLTHTVWQSSGPQVCL